MKKILTLLFLSTLFIQAQAQVLFNQDFESGALAPMIAIDVDGKTLDASVINRAGPTWSVRGNSANHLIVSTSYFSPVGVADDWVISPAINIAQANTFLTWQAFTTDPAYRDGYEVRISTTDSLIPSFTTLALNIPAENTTLTSRSLKLDAYIGQKIYFAFRNHSNDKFLLYLDNINVAVFKNRDAILTDVYFEKYNPVSTQVPINFTVQNHGADPITSLICSWTSGTTTYVDTLAGLNIPLLSSKDFIHNISFDVTEKGEFPINFTVSSPNGLADEAPQDNSGTRMIYGLSEALPKKVVVEEGTGTWCGWCPRGFVAMEQIAVDYPGVAIPIAIHNYDPMTVPEYDAAFSSTIPGFPSGHVDRKELGVDPNDPSTGYGFDDAIENLDNRLVPVQVDVQTSYDAVTRTVQIKGTAHTSIATEANSLRFLCVITENNVTGPSPSYDQANYYAGGAAGAMGGFETKANPVPANQLIYNFVARALLGGFNGLEGSIPDALTEQEYFEIDFTYQVPANYNIDEMYANVIIVDEETGEFLNADDAILSGTVSVPLVPAGKSSLYPNPASSVMNLSVEFQTDATVTMNIYDTYGRLIQNLGQLNLSNGKALEQINIADLQSGMYILELRNKNSVTALPFTKL